MLKSVRLADAMADEVVDRRGWVDPEKDKQTARLRARSSDLSAPGGADVPHRDHALPLSIGIDAKGALADLELLAQAAKRSLQLRQRLLDLGDLGAHLRCVDLDLAAAEPAAQLRIRLELSDRLAELALAVRAGDFDAL